MNWLTIFIASASNFSASYNFTSIVISLIIMSVSVCTSTPENCLLGKQAPWVSVTSSAISFVGAIVGQLTMGYLGDVIGRSEALLVTMLLASFSALLSGVAPSGQPTTVYIVIVIFRVFLGVGVGVLLKFSD